MTQEDQILLLTDLSARVPYHPYILIRNEEKGVLESITVLEDGYFAEVWWDGFNYDIEKVKPYLRSLSSMTEEEHIKLKAVYDNGSNGLFDEYSHVDWLNAHHFDYRYLIKKGLALEAPEGMYN